MVVAVNQLSIVRVDGLPSWRNVLMDASWADDWHPGFVLPAWISSCGVPPPFLYLGRNGEKMGNFLLCYLYTFTN